MFTDAAVAVRAATVGGDWPFGVEINGLEISIRTDAVKLSFVVLQLDQFRTIRPRPLNAGGFGLLADKLFDSCAGREHGKTLVYG